jgi:hypothetical protein
VTATEGVPAEVVDWYAAEVAPALTAAGADELEGLDADQRARTVPGTIRPVMTWAPGVIAGTDLDPPAVPTEQWVAPLLYEGTAVGVLFTVLDDDGAPALDHIHGGEDLSAAVVGLTPADPFVHDVPLDAWFTVSDGVVRPLDEAARDTLAGSVPLEVYQPFLAERYAEVDDDAGHDPVAADRREWVPVAVVAGSLLVLLAWAALVVWLRRPEGERGDGAARARPVRRPGPAASRGVRR